MTQHGQPYMNTRADASIQFLGLPTVIRSAGAATNGAFALLEHITMPPGFATPYHTHSKEDEAFYVLAGEVAFVCDDNWTVAGAGAYVFGPRGIRHGFKIGGDAPAQMLILCSPAGFENFVLELGEPIGTPPAPPDIAKLVAVAERYGIEIHGPLPEQP